MIVKSLEVVTPAFTTRKSWTNWKSPSFFGTTWKLRLQNKSLLWNLDRQAKPESRSWNLLAWRTTEIIDWYEHLSGHFDELAGGWLCTSLRVKISWRCGLGREVSTFCGLYFRNLTIFSWWRAKKDSLRNVLARRRERQLLWNMTKHSPSQKPILQVENITRVLTHLEEEHVSDSSLIYPSCIT